MKASTQISAWTDFTRTYEGNIYDFHVYGAQAQGLPQNYSFNSDVIDYVISKSGDAYNHTIYDSGIYFVDWGINTSMDLAQGILSLFANAYISLNSFAQDYIYKNWSGVYLWEFEFTGADENYVGSADYGTAYGFTFHGLCGDKIDLVLDASGDFYGQNRLGNWTFGVQTPEYIPHIINQADPDNVWIPNLSYSNFGDLKPPYIDGYTLNFFYYTNNVEHHCTITDFRDTSITLHMFAGQLAYLNFYNKNHNVQGTLDGSPVNLTNYQPTRTYINNQNIVSNGDYFYTTSFGFYRDGSYADSINLPSYYGSEPIVNYNARGCLNNQIQYGSCNIYLSSVSYTPVTPSTMPLPVDVPIPVEQIPSDPEQPLPNNPSPDPVPGIEYPINPNPIPLPPFASIVSGNDDLWGLTVDLNGTENSLLPYLNSLATFEFPSFDSLISDFSGSIIWVAQLMSVLYNGSSFNVLFVALCLFSLVSIIIGGYKLWSTTEPDPNNPGFRRTKKPPKGPKGRRRR